jgi:hypothetical protein
MHIVTGAVTVAIGIMNRLCSYLIEIVGRRPPALH